MMRMRLTPLLVALTVLSLASVARADESAPHAWGQERGFSIGLKYLVDGLGANESSDPIGPVIDDIGSGLVVLGGYSFTPRFHTRLTLGGAQHRTDVSGLDVQRSLGTIEAHYRFMPDRQVCPYVFGSLGGTDVRANQGINHVKFTGSMAGIGAGTMVGFTPNFLMDVTLRFDGVNWNTVEFSQDQPDGSTLRLSDPIEDSGSSARLELGFVWAF